MEIYYLMVFFIFGLVFGSFFNVVGYRLPNGMSLTSPSSHCPKCNHKLSPIELVPVFSYIFLGGKCKNCHKHIPIFYPIFELFTGILFAITYKIFGISIDTFIALVFISMILIIIISDILYMIIPDELLIFCGLVLLMLEVIKGDAIIILLKNMFIPFIIMYLLRLMGNAIFKKESLGWGDIKLIPLFGLVLGWPISLFTIVLASFIALPISLFTIKKNTTHEIPFGPYLGISAIICLLLKIDISDIINLIM